MSDVERPGVLDRRPGQVAAVVFVAALAAHGALGLQYRGDPFSTLYVADALSYHEWGSRIAQHGLAAEPVFHQAPLFPILLGGIYASIPEGLRPEVALALQTILNSLALALLVLLGRSYLGSTTAGLAAAVLGLLHGPFLFYGLKLLAVPVTLFTQALALVLLARALRKDRILDACLAGLAWGAACAARAEMLLFAPVGVLALLLPPRAARGSPGRRILLASGYLLALAFSLAPLTLHNLRRGDFVLVASAGGENLYVGNQPSGDGGHTPLASGAGNIFSQREAARAIAEQGEGRELRPSEVSSYWRARAFREVRDDPRGWLGLELRKLGRLLDPGDPNDIYPYALERRHYLSLLYGLPLTVWPLVALAFAGLVLAGRRGWNRFAPLCALGALQVLLLLVFFVDARLRLAPTFFLLPFAGFAVIGGLRRWHDRDGRAAVLAAAAAVLSLTIAGAALVHPTESDVLRLSSVLSLQDRLAEAEGVLRPWLDVPHPDPYLLDQAGWLRQKQGQFEDAARLYVDALLGGLSAERECQTRTRLARVYEGLARFNDAGAQHDAAVASGKANAGTFFERGTFRARRHDREGSRRDLEEAIRLDPTWPAPRTALHSLFEEKPGPPPGAE